MDQNDKSRVAFQVRMSAYLADKLKAVAAAENRSMNKQIELYVWQGVTSYEREHGKIEPAKE